MKPRALLLAVLLAGCGVPQLQPVVPANTRVGALAADSTRTFFDSLAAARAGDTVAVHAVAVETRSPEALADLAWLDILRDSTLVGLTRRALRDNPQMAIARARIREYRAASDVVRSGLFPSLTLNANTSRNKVAFGSLAIPAYTAWRSTADVSWDSNLFGVGSGLQAANADLAAQQAYEQATALAVVAEVASGYLQLLEFDQEQTIAQQALASRRETYDLAKQRYGRGVISELDVRQFEAQMAVPAVRLAQVAQARAIQEHALNTLIGEGPVAIPRGSSLARAARAITVPDSVPVELIERRPDVIAAERQFHAAAARVGVAVAARLPKLSITSYYGGQAAQLGTLSDSKSRIYQIMAGISVPLFKGGELTGQQHMAEARADEARAQYRETLLTALQEAGDALVGVRGARDQLAAQQTQAAALSRALELATLRYKSGIANYLEVLEAQRSFFEAQLAESQAELQELTAAVRLYKALGGSWQQ